MMKRFYKQVAAVPVEEGIEVRLDGRTVRTPAKVPLRVPRLELAHTIAAEWEAQEQEIKPHTMPLTQLANTTIDLVRIKREEVVGQTVAYGETDLLCYRVDQPAELVQREARHWQPLLDWVALRHDAALLVVNSIMPRPQPEGAIQALRSAVEAVDHWVLTGLQQATAASGSLVLGLALVERQIDAVQAFELSQLHETYQIEQWGADEEAVKRREALAADLQAIGRWLELLGP
jgi:chaperone required for assembly of F1-ATPase